MLRVWFNEGEYHARAQPPRNELRLEIEERIRYHPPKPPPGKTPLPQGTRSQYLTYRDRKTGTIVAEAHRYVYPGGRPVRDPDPKKMHAGFGLLERGHNDDGRCKPLCDMWYEISQRERRQDAPHNPSVDC